MNGRRAACWLLLAVVALVAGCGNGSTGKTVITFWTMGAEGQAVRQLIPAFEKAHPDIRVDVQTLPWTGAHQKLLTAIAGGSTPDLCQLGNTWLPELTMLGALAPLDRRVAASNVIEPRDYFAGIWHTNVVDGTLYGIPWYVDTRLLFYRKDILARAGFDHPPRTWVEWARQLAAVKKMVGPDRYAVLLPTNEFEQLESFGLQQKQPMLRDGGRYGNFQTPGFKHALRFYAQMFRKGWAPAVANTEVANVWTEFARGYYSFYVTGPWSIEQFKARMPTGLEHAWGTAPLPSPDGSGGGLAGGASLVIFKDSKHKRAAWQLIEYLSRPDVQRRFHAIAGDMPPRRASWEHSQLASDPRAQAFRKQLEHVEPVPKVPEWQQIAKQLRIVGAQLANGKLTVDQAAEELDQRADRILAKRRWVLARDATP
ncbi:MAG TPA: sugar ABC transporter substrate-binding protein [Oleiagrimonas sp.]|nr:sugar ABC transporter substrate-binding protein [Oleiagrimonas sp.]